MNQNAIALRMSFSSHASVIHFEIVFDRAPSFHSDTSHLLVMHVIFAPSGHGAATATATATAPIPRVELLICIRVTGYEGRGRGRGAGDGLAEAVKRAPPPLPMFLPSLACSVFG